LPGGQAFVELAAWVAEYQGHELDWDLNLILAQDQVPTLQLDAGRRLGFDTWLGQPKHDARDLKLARYYADQPVAVPLTRNQDHG
jgi:type VI secretion system protein ImpH